MCLKLENASVESKIAEEDIICWKFISLETKPVHDISKNEELHGKKFHGIIDGIQCEGRVSIEFERSYIYFCTNDYRLNGKCADELFGYEYSWVLDDRVEEIIFEDTDYKITCIKAFITPYQSFLVKEGETYISELNKHENEIQEGLHTFVNKADMVRIDRDYVAECIIPKGSKYYVGTFMGYSSYASDKLTYTKITKHEDFVTSFNAEQS